jgi:phytoene dehydrogenase-like protein
LSTRAAADAVVVGAGPNGLVAANLLADAGWDVLLLEAQPVPGGAVRSSELIEPGFVNDWFSAFYPLAAASPVLTALDLESYGLRWRRAPLVVAHPDEDGTCPVLSMDHDETAASLDADHPGDGAGWRELADLWDQAGGAFVEALLSPIPPVRATGKLATRLGAAGLVRLGRLALMPVRRLGQEQFRGAGGRRLLAGCALHADLTPDTAGGGLFGWLLCGLGAQYGFPVPEGGAGELSAALARRLEAHGGRIQCGVDVERVVIAGGRAVGVRAGGTEYRARRAVLADVGAPRLYHQMIGDDLLPAGLRRDLERFQYDNGTVKVDWALSGPIPWSAPEARRAGTVHTGSLDRLTQAAAALCMEQIPERPFLVVGQMTTADPTRSPAGTEAAWAYTHVPADVHGDAGGANLKGLWDERETEIFVARMEDQMERLAPGFRGLIRGRYVFTPPGLEAHDANLAGGAINGGTAQLHQQAFFRPTPGLGRAETPFPGLYLASASAHPGGGVHGACGANAARAALAPGRRLRTAAARRIAR